MILKIERYKVTQNYTLGNLYIDGELIGKVCEPPVLAIKNSDELSAIPEGYYGIRVSVNPSTGTPCIKLKNDKVANNISIRCLRPMSPNNASPWICKVNAGDKPDWKNLAFDTWSRLLQTCVDNNVNAGESYLFISNLYNVKE